jgi:hypothetical protein
MVPQGISGTVHDTRVPQKITDSDTTPFSIKVGSNPAEEHTATGRGVGEQGTNIGYYIYRINPTEFFSPQFKAVYTGVIPITGLTANTDYYARIFLSNNNTNGELAGAFFSLYGNIVHFKTAAAGAAGNNSVNDILTGVVFQGQAGAGAQDDIVNELSGGSCEISLIGGDFDLQGCLIRIYYKVVYKSSAWLVWVTARLLDAFVNISIQSNIYRSTFVADGWRIVRDISNMLFIFILLYTAIGTIIGLHHNFNPKKIITKVIVIGLLINFSLFFTRFIVDTGNIFAHLFYNKIGETSIIGFNSHPISLGNKERSISSGIATGLNLQKILSPESFDLIKDKLTPGTLTALITVGLIINIAAAWLFFTSAAYFLGRIGVLWMAMIFAPLAFVSSIIPGLDSKLKQLGWHSWLASLTSASFNAAIFLFFLYLIVSLVQSNFLGTIVADGSQFENWVEYLAALSIPVMIIIGLMKAAKDVAKEMGGQFGEAFAGAVNTVVGVGATAALGAVALGGSQLVGRFANKTLQNQDLKDVMSGDEGKLNALKQSGAFSGKFDKYDFTKAEDRAKAQKWAEGKMQGAQKWTERSFDLRQTGIGNAISSATGVNLNAGAAIGLGALGLGTETTAGGFASYQQRQVAKKQKVIEQLGYNEELYHHKEAEKKKHEDELDNLQKQYDGERDTQREKEKERNELAQDVNKIESERKEARAVLNSFQNRRPTDAAGQARYDAAKQKLVDTEDDATGATGKAAQLRNLNNQINRMQKGGTTTDASGATVTYIGTDVLSKQIEGQNRLINKDNKELETIKTEREKSYIKHLSEVAKPDNQTWGRPVRNAWRESVFSKDGLKTMLGDALKGGLAGGALLGPGGMVTGAIVGGLRSAITGGVLPTLKHVFEKSGRTFEHKFTGSRIDKLLFGRYKAAGAHEYDVYETDSHGTGVARDVNGNPIPKRNPDGTVKKAPMGEWNYKTSQQEVAETLSHGAGHGKHFQITYKMPNSDLFSKLFGGLGGGGGHGGGGGGHDDHGHGGGDHH